MKDILKPFFLGLPKRVKAILHLVELMLCFYAATSVGLLFTPLGEFVKPYLEVVAVAFLLLFPLIHVIVEFAFVDQAKPPGSDISDALSEKITDTLLTVLDSARTNPVETKKPNAKS